MYPDSHAEWRALERRRLNEDQSLVRRDRGLVDGRVPKGREHSFRKSRKPAPDRNGLGLAR
jgi:hypothetical protein